MPSDDGPDDGSRADRRPGVRLADGRRADGLPADRAAADRRRASAGPGPRTRSTPTSCSAACWSRWSRSPSGASCSTARCSSAARISAPALWRPVAGVGLGSASSSAAGMVAGSVAPAPAGVDWRIAVLCGAILTLSGPTVVAPLLRSHPPDQAGRHRAGVGGHPDRPDRRDRRGAHLPAHPADGAGGGRRVLRDGRDRRRGAAWRPRRPRPCSCAQRRVPITTSDEGTLALVLLAVAGSERDPDDAGLVAAIALRGRGRDADRAPGDAGARASSSTSGRRWSDLLIGRAVRDPLLAGISLS